MTATRRPLCPRCKKKRIAGYDGKGPRPKYCGERSCYEEYYSHQRQLAKDALNTEVVQLAVLIEGNRIRKEMQRKVALVVGTEAKSGPRITEALPRGGALVILSARERNDVLAYIAALDAGLGQAIDALGKSRLLVYREIARNIRARRGILDLLGHEYLLSPIPER